MKNTGLKEYKNARVGAITTEQTWRGERLILCKGIYVNDDGQYFTGHQYIDKKQSRKNKRITVSGKSPFWFEPINQ